MGVAAMQAEPAAEHQDGSTPIDRLRDALALPRRMARRVGEIARMRTDALPLIRALGATGLPVLRCDHGGRATRKSALIANAPPALAEAHAAAMQTPIDPPAGDIAIVRSARLSAGIVSCADGTVIEESLINIDGPGTYGRYRRDEDGTLRLAPSKFCVARHLRGRPHVLLKQRYDSNYGHWLVEGLPRLAGIEEHFDLADLKFIVSAHHGPMQEVYRDSLALFGIRPDQIVEVGDEPIHVDTLIYPTPITRHPWHFAPRCISVLEDMATRVRANLFGFERIYVSRNQIGRRRLLNEQAILAIVESHGFVAVEPEAVGLFGQVGLFRKARIVIGNYGGALANAAFATDDVTLFALTSEFMPDDFFSTLMSLKHGRYLSQHGTAADPAKGYDSDFSIDVEQFRAILSTVL